MRLLRGQDDDLSLVNGVRVLQAVGVALEDRLVLRGASIVRLRGRAERITRENGVERFARASDGETHSVTELVGQDNHHAFFQRLCAGLRTLKEAENCPMVDSLALLCYSSNETDPTNSDFDGEGGETYEN